MRPRRFIPTLLLFSALGALGAQTACADEAAAIYNPSTVDAIELTLPKESEETLEKEPTENYVKGTLTLRETSGTPGTEGPPVINGMEVGIRLKGNVGGSFRDLKTGKAAFKIKCNFVKGKKCLGLKKMTLNNMVQDPSMVHETLAYSAFRAAGVPASRTGYAYVRVNGEDFGLYLDLETLDDVSLARLFGSFDDKTQHLYEGEGGHDVTPGEAPEFEIDEGEEDRTDLEALIEAVNGGGEAPWSERVAANADLAEMTKMWAVEKYIDHWDGYSGHAEAGLRPNNYYLYSEPSGRFQMLPWGADQTWIPTIGVGTPQREVTFDGAGGVLFNKCLADEGCFRMYWEALDGVTEGMAALDPAGLATDAAALLAPWQAEERAHGRAESSQGEVEGGVEETLEFIASRRAEAAQWLSENEPPAKAGAPHVATPVAPRTSAPPVPSLVPGRFAVKDGVLVSRIWVGGAGALQQRVSIPTQRGRLRVCATGEQVPGAGPVVLRCRLSDAARRRLGRKSLRLRAYTTFAPAGSTGTAAVRNLTAPRDPSL